MEASGVPYLAPPAPQLRRGGWLWGQGVSPLSWQVSLPLSCRWLNPAAGSRRSGDSDRLPSRPASPSTGGGGVYHHWQWCAGALLARGVCYRGTWNEPWARGSPGRLCPGTLTPPARPFYGASGVAKFTDAMPAVVAGAVDTVTSVKVSSSPCLWVVSAFRLAAGSRALSHRRGALCERELQGRMLRSFARRWISGAVGLASGIGVVGWLGPASQTR